MGPASGFRYAKRPAAPPTRSRLFDALIPPAVPLSGKNCNQALGRFIRCFLRVFALRTEEEMLCQHLDAQRHQH
jgi:hypothetical protein